MYKNLKKIISATLIATGVFTTVAYASTSYNGGLKTSGGSGYNHALAWTQAADGRSQAMAYVAIYERSGVKLASSNNNYGYGYTQTETITANNHKGNYAVSRHGRQWNDAYTNSKSF